MQSALPHPIYNLPQLSWVGNSHGRARSGDAPRSLAFLAVGGEGAAQDAKETSSLRILTALLSPLLAFPRPPQCSEKSFLCPHASGVRSAGSTWRWAPGPAYPIGFPRDANCSGMFAKVIKPFPPPLFAAAAGQWPQRGSCCRNTAWDCPRRAGAQAPAPGRLWGALRLSSHGDRHNSQFPNAPEPPPRAPWLPAPCKQPKPHQKGSSCPTGARAALFPVHVCAPASCPGVCHGLRTFLSLQSWGLGPNLLLQGPAHSLQRQSTLQGIKPTGCVRALQVFSRSVLGTPSTDHPSTPLVPENHSSFLPRTPEHALLAAWPFLNVALNKSVYTQEKKKIKKSKKNHNR